MIDPADEPAVGGDAIECGRGAEVDHDAVPGVAVERPQDVHDPVGTHAKGSSTSSVSGSGVRASIECARWPVALSTPSATLRVTGGTTEARQAARTSSASARAA